MFYGRIVCFWLCGWLVVLVWLFLDWGVVGVRWWWWWLVWYCGFVVWVWCLVGVCWFYVFVWWLWSGVYCCRWLVGFGFLVRNWYVRLFFVVWFVCLWVVGIVLDRWYVRVVIGGFLNCWIRWWDRFWWLILGVFVIYVSLWFEMVVVCVVLLFVWLIGCMFYCVIVGDVVGIIDYVVFKGGVIGYVSIFE